VVHGVLAVLAVSLLKGQRSNELRDQSDHLGGTSLALGLLDQSDSMKPSGGAVLEVGDTIRAGLDGLCAVSRIFG